MHTQKTFALNTEWELTTQAGGLISMKTGAAATAQNVANECRLFRNDAVFNKDRGIRYHLEILGQQPNLSFIESEIRTAAYLVQDVQGVERIDLEPLDTSIRKLSGEITVTTKEGGSGNAYI